MERITVQSTKAKPIPAHASHPNAGFAPASHGYGTTTAAVGAEAWGREGFSRSPVALSRDTSGVRTRSGGMLAQVCGRRGCGGLIAERLLLAKAWYEVENFGQVIPWSF